jgi:hypothetical protein
MASLPAESLDQCYGFRFVFGDQTRPDCAANQAIED